MPRQKRYYSPGAFYHIMLRGNDGQLIFFNDQDRCRMCLLIQEGIERYGHRIHAFCMMSNHIHLLVQVGNTPLSKIVHNLAFRYSQYVNRRYQKIGHLFQGRFKAILIEEKAYFLRLLRYIHMNPVRAYLTKNPEDYTWSSHCAYLGEMEFVWVATNYGLNKFAVTLDEARSKYRGYVYQQESEESLKELRRGFTEGQILGGDEFLDAVRNSQNSASIEKIPLENILESLCQVYDTNQIALTSPSRSDRLSLARGACASFAKQNGHTLVELAKAFNRDESSLSRLLKRFLQRHAECISLQNQYKQLEETVLKLADTRA